MAESSGTRPRALSSGSESTNYDDVSVSSRSNTTATANSFSRGFFRNPSGYRRMLSSGIDHELSEFDDSATPTASLRSTTANIEGEEAGLSVLRNSSAHVPIRMSPPGTPHSYSALIDHASVGSPGTAGASPSTIHAQPASNYLSPDLARTLAPNSPPERADWTPSMPASARVPAESDANDATSNVRTAPPIVQANSPGVRSIGGLDYLEPRGEMPSDDDEFDDEAFYTKFREPPSQCWSNKDIHQPRTSWLSITIYVLSLYSTILSGIWLVTAILQPRWGKQISSHQGLLPSTATTIAALLAKTVEMSFVTVFVSFIGQVLTRRSFIRKANGMSLAEMTMRNWVIQPGSLVTHFETVASSALTLLGVLSLTATFAAAFYTTASDAMVAPKLKFGKWDHKEIGGYVRTSYANAVYARDDCPYMISLKQDSSSSESCMNIQLVAFSLPLSLIIPPRET